MSPELIQLGVMLINSSLRRAMDVSTHMENGTLTKEYLDSLVTDDDRARAEQIASRDRAKAEGR